MDTPSHGGSFQLVSTKLLTIHLTKARTRKITRLIKKSKTADMDKHDNYEWQTATKTSQMTKDTHTNRMSHFNSLHMQLAHQYTIEQSTWHDHCHWTQDTLKHHIQNSADLIYRLQTSSKRDRDMLISSEAVTVPWIRTTKLHQSTTFGNLDENNHIANPGMLWDGMDKTVPTGSLFSTTFFLSFFLS